MTKDKTPEAGDLWESLDGRKWFILKKKRRFVYMLGMCINSDKGIRFAQKTPSAFDKNNWQSLHYLGKSRVDLSQLFEIKETPND